VDDAIDSRTFEIGICLPLANHAQFNAEARTTVWLLRTR
jgi:hypothetical protein